MSDDQTPAAPAPPSAPEAPPAVTLNVPPSLAGTGSAAPETPEGPAADPADPPAPDTDPQDGAETPAAVPVVTTTPTGQSVALPDGRTVWTRATDAPVSNSEWAVYEHTHQGDQLRYPYVPGDREYTPYSDPNVPNSALAQQVEREIGSFAERVLQDPAAQVSYIWNALHGMHEGALDRAIATGVGSDKAAA